MSKLSQPRETGSEKSGDLCDKCGTDVPLLTSVYGSTTPGVCPSCWPDASPTQLEAQVAAASEPKSLTE